MFRTIKKRKIPSADSTIRPPSSSSSSRILFNNMRKKNDDDDPVRPSKQPRELSDDDEDAPGLSLFWQQNKKKKNKSPTPTMTSTMTTTTTDASTTPLWTTSTSSSTTTTSGPLRFDPDDLDDEPDHSGRKKSDTPVTSSSKKGQKRTRGGFGFGGGQVVDRDDDQDPPEDHPLSKAKPIPPRDLPPTPEEEDLSGANLNVEISSSSRVAYDAASLQRLKAEQLLRAAVRPWPPEASAKALVDHPPSGDDDHPLDDTQQENTKQGTTHSLPTALVEPSPSLPDFIPLSGGSRQHPRQKPVAGLLHVDEEDEEPSTILTGDEALDWENRNQDRTHREALDSVQVDSSDDRPHDLLASTMDGVDEGEEDLAWETQLARRAGVVRETKPEEAALPSRPLRRSDSHSLTPEQLRAQVESTLQVLEAQQEDLRSAHARRKHQYTLTQEELGRHESTMRSAGHAVEFYQQLRVQLAEWVGALRDLKSKVISIQETMHELESDVAGNQRWVDWENDTLAVLHQRGLLQQVVGRQPSSSIFEDSSSAMTVDEFGRQVQSKEAMQREKRQRNRRQIREQRGGNEIRGDESDAFLSDGEIESCRSRDKALRKALSVAKLELDEEYTSLQNLVDLFDNWRKEYPDDYQESFAMLSLADLAGVLIQVELCSLNDPWNKSEGYNEAKWTAVIHAALEASTLDQGTVERMIEHSVLSVISNMLQGGGINLTSTRQTKAIGDFLVHLQKLLPRESRSLGLIFQRLVAYVEQSLEVISIPILTEAARNLEIADDDEELREALQAATTGQMNRIKKVLLNILTSWAPLRWSSTKLPELILDFLSNKFLFLLSSLHGYPLPVLSESPADVFGAVWNAIEPLGWLDRPEFLVQAAPIQAAASAYNIITRTT